jgi:N-acetyl sugar amidotransferase
MIELRLPPLWSDEVEARIRREAYSLDQQAREQPREVRFCVRCVVSNQRPRITFDDDGVCSACRYAERQRVPVAAGGIDWDHRSQQLRALLDAHRRSTGYDVIVPCSGGKDSAMVAHRLKHDHGMNPLCTTFAPFVYTDIGFQNFQAFVHSGFDVVTAFPNGLVHRKLARLCGEFLGDFWQAFTYGQLAFPMQMASKYKVPLVFGAENGEAAYSGDLTAADKPRFDYADWDRVYLKGMGVQRLINIGRELDAFSDIEVRQLCDFYFMPFMGEDRPEYYWLSYFMPHHPMGNFYEACEKTGFTPNSERSEQTYTKFASIDDRLDPFHYRWAVLKFGIGRATSDAAEQIRAGDITRDEGVALVKRYDTEFPAREYDLFKAYLGIDDEHYVALETRYRSPHIWDGDKLKHAVWHAEKTADSPPRHQAA